MKAMIFAAGLGTRLRPITDTMPKALVPVGGKPLIAIVIEKLKAAGYDDIVVNVHHFADMIEDYVHSMGDFGVKVSFSDERERLLDTGGGILKARHLLEGAGSFLVHNVDILSEADLAAFRSAAEADSLATLMVSPRETSRYLLFDGGMRMVGWTNVMTSQVRGDLLLQGNIQVEDCARYAFSGIHLLSDKIFPLLENYAKDNSDKFSITDFYIACCSSNKIKGHVPEQHGLLDVGKADSLTLAEQFLHPSC